jgi:hypothetical protein
MIRRSLVLGLLFSLFSVLFFWQASSSFVLAEGVDVLTMDEACEIDIRKSVESIAFSTGGTEGGFVAELRSLLSTHMPTRPLVREAKVILEDHRQLLGMVCEGAGKFEEMTDSERDAFSLPYCAAFGREQTSSIRSNVVSYCEETIGNAVDGMMTIVKVELMRDALEEGTRILVESYKRLNSKLPSLVEEYVRVVNNFFKLNFRLGRFVITKPQ